MKKTLIKKWILITSIALILAACTGGYIALAEPALTSGPAESTIGEDGDATAESVDSTTNGSGWGEVYDECIKQYGGSYENEGEVKPAGTTNTPTPAKSGTAPTIDASELGNISVLLTIEAFANKLFWPIMMLSGGLLDNSLIFSGGMEEQLYEIWVPIRNLVNILFVLGLVAVALYNVLGIGDENATYSLKAVLPKIIISLIAINFSFTFIKVGLELVETLTTSIFSLPQQISTSFQVLNPESPYDREKIKRFCELSQNQNIEDISNLDIAGLEAIREFNVYRSIATKEEYLGKDGVTGTMTSKASIMTEIEKLDAAKQKAFNDEIAVVSQKELCTAENQLTDYGRQFFKNFSARNAALAMAINMGKVVFYKDVPLDGLQSLETLTINTIFSIIFYLVYIIVFLILFLILLGRVVVIWLGVALSPVLMILLVASDLTQQLSGSLSDLGKKFLDHALAPLKIAVVMSIGWIMLNAINGFNAASLDSTVTANSAIGFPVVGLSTLQDIIVALGSIAVVWMGVKAVSSDLITNVITEKITGFAEDAAKWVAAIPFKHTVAIPVYIPGDTTPTTKNYTLPAIATAATEAFRDRPDYSLADELGFTGKKDTRPDAWDNVKSQQSLIDHLGNFKAARDHEGLAKQKQWLEKWRRDNSGVQLDEWLKQGIDKILKAENESDAIKAADELLKDRRILVKTTTDKPAAEGAGTPPAGGQPSAPAPGQPPATPPAPITISLKEAANSGDNNQINTAIQSSVNAIIQANPKANNIKIEEQLRTQFGDGYDEFRDDNIATINRAIQQARNPQT